MSFDPAATRPIGRRSLAVSQLGVGTAPFGSFAREDSDTAIGETFACLYAAGLRYFDTAPFYGLGLAEHRLGAALRTVDRRSIVLETKIGRMMKPVAGGIAQGITGGTSPFEVAFDYSYDGTLRSLEHSMQRLQTNAVDIKIIHDVNRRWQGDLVEQALSRGHGRRPSRAARPARDGAIKAFGVGVNDWTILRRFAADGDFDVSCSRGGTPSSTTRRSTRSCRIASAAVFRAHGGAFNSGIRPRVRSLAPRSSMSRPRRRSWTAPAGSKRFAGVTASLSRLPRSNFACASAVSSVVTGMRSVREAQANLAHCHALIPRAFWDELKHEGLIAPHAPVPGSG